MDQDLGRGASSVMTENTDKMRRRSIKIEENIPPFINNRVGLRLSDAVDWRKDVPTPNLPTLPIIVDSSGAVLIPRILVFREGKIQQQHAVALQKPEFKPEGKDSPDTYSRARGIRIQHRGVCVSPNGEDNSNRNL